MPEIANGTPDLVPRPDPTALTTEQLRREVRALRELVETRLDAMDKASEVLETNVNMRVERQLAATDASVEHLASLHDEKFSSLKTAVADLREGTALRFQERDTRSEREARDNKIAVDAAFAAAKEAVAENNKSSQLANDKTEASFTKQIDAQARAVDSKFQATDDKIDDIKEQLSNRRGHETAVVEAKTNSQWNTTTVIAVTFGVLSLLISTIVVIILIAKG